MFCDRTTGAEKTYHAWGEGKPRRNGVCDQGFVGEAKEPSLVRGFDGSVIIVLGVYYDETEKIELCCLVSYWVNKLILMFQLVANYNNSVFNLRRRP